MARLGVVIDDGVEHDVLRLCDRAVGVTVCQCAIPEALTSPTAQIRVTDPQAARACAHEFLPKLSCKKEQEGLWFPLFGTISHALYLTQSIYLRPRSLETSKSPCAYVCVRSEIDLGFLGIVGSGLFDNGSPFVSCGVARTTARIQYLTKGFLKFF